MLLRCYKLSDIREYEETSRESILDKLRSMRICDILDLISLGNGGCGEYEAGLILDNYLEDHSLTDVVNEIKSALLGDTSNVRNDDTIDVSEYDTLTDLYIRYSMELMSVGLGYSDIWGMNTKEIYKVFNSIIVKMENETNRELSNYHTLAAMVGQAVWGKLKRDAPKVKLSNEADTMEVANKLLQWANNINMGGGIHD